MLINLANFDAYCGHLDASLADSVDHGSQGAPYLRNLACITVDQFYVDLGCPRHLINVSLSRFLEPKSQTDVQLELLLPENGLEKLGLEGMASLKDLNLFSFVGQAL